MLVIRIPIDSLESIGRAYGTGILFAGHHFIQANPDWYSRLGEGLFYAVAWPYSLYKAIKQT